MMSSRRAVCEPAAVRITTTKTTGGGGNTTSSNDGSGCQQPATGTQPRDALSQDLQCQRPTPYAWRNGIR
jgi:hypothetical protein